ncbi:MAG TPA: cupin domain-containing protein [Tepidisphaeraceae bacterium]|jgi:quercetin dioxygenase-like cupin family protein
MSTLLNTPVAAGALVARVLHADEGDQLNVMGSDTRVKFTGADTGGKLSMFVVTATPGDGVPMHTHTHEDEIFYVLEGRIRFDTGGESTVAGPGATAFLPRSVAHAWWVEGEQSAKAIILTLPGTFDAFFAELACPPGVRPDMAAVVQTCARYGITFA